MSPSTNTRSGPNTSSETTKLSLSPLNSSYVTQNYTFNKTKFLLANFDYKHAKQDEKFKEYVKILIGNQDATFDKKFEKHIQPL